uniref:DUF19 domain-containing protein n=1 Tax=Strongyloides venezuelensis TaxID=75913 RepID=A0A0K0EZY3_STRVS
MDKFGFPTEQDDVICGKTIFKQNQCIVNKYLGCLTEEMKIEKFDGLCIERITKTCGYNEPHASKYTGSYNVIRNAKEVLSINYQQSPCPSRSSMKRALLGIFTVYLISFKKRNRWEFFALNWFT